MHVCLVNALFPPEAHGGAENYVYRTATALEGAGHDVSVLTTQRFDGLESLQPERTDYDGLDVWRFFPLNVGHRSGGTGGNVLSKAVWHGIDIVNPRAPRVVRLLVKRLDPDVVHTNNLMGMSAGIGRAIQGLDVHHVHTLHDYSLICPKSNLLREFTAPGDEPVVCESPPAPCRVHAGSKRRLLGSPDVVTGPSQHVIDVHRRHGYFEDVPCRRLQLGVEDVADEPPSIPEEPSILYVGKQLRAKGLDTLFDTAGRMPDVTFHVCGSGPYEDESERRARELPNLVYHGHVPGAKLRQLRADATAAVVPSIWMENSPLTIYESFANGLPVVGSDIGGIPELVAEGERGYLFEAGNVCSLASAIEDVLDHEPAMRANALEWASERTFETHVDRLCAELYSG